jgi:hypothetical protein
MLFRFPPVDRGVCHSYIFGDTLHSNIYNISCFSEASDIDSISTQFILQKRSQHSLTCVLDIWRKHRVNNQMYTVVSRNQVRAIAPTLHVTNSRHLVHVGEAWPR